MGWKGDVFKDHRVQALLSKFMSEKLQVIRPVFDLKRGVTYPDVEEIVGGPPEDGEFLAMLCNAGVLHRELYDKVLYCPSCGSANVSIHYSCPYCKSFDVKKSSLIEHVKCGYIDIEEKFHVGNKLVCPKCHVALAEPDVDYRKAGVWCTCNKCGKSFDIPVPYHFCRGCSHVFNFEEAVFKEAYTYRLNEEAVEHAALDWTILAPIRSLMEEKGFRVETPGFLDGKSGVKHMFDIVAHSKGTEKNITVINVSTSKAKEPVPDQPIIEMFAKTFDSPVDKAFLIAIPKISENGRKLANLYKINVVEAKNPEEAITKLDKHLPA